MKTLVSVKSYAEGVIYRVDFFKNKNYSPLFEECFELKTTPVISFKVGIWG